MRKSLLSVLLASLTSVMLIAQVPAQRSCGTMDNLQRLEQLDPGLTARMQQIENQTAAYVNALSHNHSNTTQTVVTIPVVFHVVYSSSSQNISDAQCQAQLNQLNQDYAHINSDAANAPAPFLSLAANTQVQFCMAQRDPNGNATTGVVHKSTTTTSFSSNDNIKHSSTGGDDAWPAGSYLNIWSCNLGGGLLGYAQFPGGAAATDGVVFLYSSIGSIAQPGTATPYNLGRTATHEVGHWLNLRHIWGDANCGDDFVADTPTQQTSNFGCPAYPHKTCGNTTNGDMFMNYMDYTDDGCMNMFTTGQTTRMQALFATGGTRVSLLSSLGCTPPSGGSCGVPVTQAASAITTSSATLNWAVVSGAASYNVQYRVNGGAAWTSSSSATNSLPVSGLAASTTYEFQVQAVCGATSSAFSASGTFTTSAVAGTCGLATASATTLITTSSATINWSAVAGAASYNVQYRVSGGSTWTSTTSTTNSKALSGLSASTTYEWQVQTVCSATSTSAFTASATFTTSAVTTGCSDAYEPNNSSNTSTTIPTNTDIKALISTTSDADWFKFTTTSPNTNIKIALTTLPGDYDIRLYNSGKSQLAISQNGGTTSEQIIRNTTSAGTYYIKVYGYAGANSTTQCYTLRVNVGSTTFRTMDDQVIEDAVAVADMIVYPNPATDMVNVAFNTTQTEKTSIRIFDMVGRTVHTEDFTAESGLNKVNINLHDVVKGIYFVELTNSNNKIVKKLVLDK